jgi:hypothetical protein
MKVWIVLKNGKIDAVFDNEEAATNHRKNAIRGWNITEIIEKVVYTL